MLLNPRFTRCLIALLGCVFAVIAAQAQTPKRAAPRAAGPVADIAPAPEPAPAPAAPDSSVFLPEAARLVSLPKLTEVQIREFISDLMVELELSMGYTRAGEDGPKLPALSDKIIAGATAVRKNGAQTNVLRFGYVMNQRRLPQLWVYGVSISPTGIEPNADAALATLNPQMQALLNERAKMSSRLRLSDLQSRVINLSYIDADGALFALRAMGYSAITDDDPLSMDDSYKGEDVALLTAPPPDNAPPPAGGPGTPPGIGPDGQPQQGVPGGDAFGNNPPNAFGASSNPFGAPSNPFGAPSSPNGGGAFGGSSNFNNGGAYGGMNSFNASQPSDPNAKPRRFPASRNIPSSINLDRLPLIVKMPSPEPFNVGLVGASADPNAAGQAARENSLGLTVIPNAATQLGSTISAGTSQLMVLFHPDNVEQFVKLRRVIEDIIDKPVRQVFVEGLVLEISKQAIEELGVQWRDQRGNTSIQLGTLTQITPNAGNTAASFVRDTTTAFDPKTFFAKVNALVDRNKAEILSRPSVLTLDNRQATIRVGTDIPIATSKDSGATGGGRVSFSFQYLPTGILLNVRPRINEDGREISMIIDATVSATVPGQDLRVVDDKGATLASAPTISTRRVQTYARIINNTPLIIGGLVSRDQTKHEDKVPGLGDIPFLGRLFGYESNKDARREVIIVLTPSVLTEEFRATKPQLPKDDDRFDSGDTTLFRESYRIRAEDLIDSQYIRTNQRFVGYRNIANEVIARNPDLATRPPFSQFRGTRVPGELVFVSGMTSRMLVRLKAGEPVNIDKLTFFEDAHSSNFKTETVGGLLKRLGDGKTHKSFFEKNPGKAVSLRFRFARNSNVPGQWATEPLAEIKLHDSPNRESWKKLLWEMNQPVDGIQEHHTIVLQDESDLNRLKTAIALKNTILANGNEVATTFDNFLPGRVVSLQQISPDWERTLEATVGRYFFWGEFFYPAFADELERAISALDSALRRPEMAKYTEGIKLP